MEGIYIKILDFLQSASGASATIAIVLEFAFRLFPTKKPLSVIYIIADAIKMLGQILIKASEFLDKVLPQRIKKVE